MNTPRTFRRGHADGRGCLWFSCARPVRVAGIVLLIVLSEAGGCPACGADAVENSKVLNTYVGITISLSLLPPMMIGFLALLYRHRARRAVPVKDECLGSLKASDAGHARHRAQIPVTTYD